MLVVATTRRRLIVRGRVQGVGYRWSCREEALRLGLAGWVRNLPDGSVEVAVEGDEVAVDRLASWCRQGPSPARVTEVEAHDEVARGEQEFRISY